MLDNQIDAVITWVDGSDPILIKKQKQFLFDFDEKDLANKERFENNDEIFYCIAGLLKNAPFIRNIYIVSDNQVPDIFNRLALYFSSKEIEKIKIIDHEVIFAGCEQYLPTFNSLSIEAMLHRIPNLSDYFIYLNDDVIIANAVEAEDFFIKRKPKLRGVWRSSFVERASQNIRNIKTLKLLGIGRKSIGFKESQYLAFKLLGYNKKYFWHNHVPHPVYRPRLAQYFQSHEEILNKQISYRKRHFEQVNVMSLSDGLSIKSKESVEDPSIELTYVKLPKPHLQQRYIERKQKEFREKEHKFICLQSLTLANHDSKKQINDWLDELLLTNIEP